MFSRKQDSDADELEETQEEFLDRYAKAAADLENGLVVEEGDLEDQDYEPELGKLINLLSASDVSDTASERIICKLMQLILQLCCKFDYDSFVIGFLEEIDPEKAIFSLIERHHDVLVKGQVLPSQLVSNFVNTFPGHSSFFCPAR